MFHGEEFQMFYVDTLSHGKETSSHVRYCEQHFLPKNTGWEVGKKQSSFTVVKSNKDYPSQVINVNINNDRTY
jgi:hypothetical protein